MREKTMLFQIDGQPMLVPDQEVTLSREDIDSAYAGRDESGVMHRIPVRTKVGSWGFSYGYLTGEEYAYLEGLFGDKPTFTFTYPGLSGPVEAVCYRSKYGISYKNVRTGLWKGYSFNIIEC